MAVDGVPVGSYTLEVSGRSPFSADTVRSLAAATLVSQGLTVREPVDNTTSSVIFMQARKCSCIGNGAARLPSWQVKRLVVPAAAAAAAARKATRSCQHQTVEG